MKKKKRLLLIGDIVGILVTIALFIVPFYFMLELLKISERIQSSDH